MKSRQHAGKVCIIRHSYYPLDDRPRREAEALREVGIDVDVVCLRAPGERATETIDGVRAVRLPLRRRRGSQPRYLFDYGAFFVLASPVVAELHRRQRYAVVQANTLPDFLVFAAAIPKLAGARIILDMHELMPELYATKFALDDYHPFVKLVRVAERFSIGFSDAVITVSDIVKQRLVARGFASEKISVVMNSPDPRYFRTRRLPPPLEDSQLRIISHGTLLERYGFDTAIRAIDLLRERFPQIQLTIVGEGEFSPTLAGLVAELGLGDHVRLIGFRPLEEVGKLLAQAHIGLALNKIDRFTRFIVPTKLLEYVMVGVPAVVARSPAVEEYFDDSCVKMVQSDDAEDVARAIAELASDPRTAAAMAKRAAEGFVPEYGWERMKRRYVGLVEELAATARPAAR